jgi:hypothetical protein
VLEFAALGIPSLVSHEHQSTYPEIFQQGLAVSVDWTKLSEVEQIIREKFKEFKENSQNIPDEILSTVSIKSHVDTLIRES